MATTFAYRDEKMLLDMVMTAIENGNRDTGKAFVPTPDQYERLCKMANDLEASIKNAQEMYGLK